MNRHCKKPRFFTAAAAVLLFVALCGAILAKCDLPGKDSGRHVFTSASQTTDEAFDRYMENLFRQEVSGSALTLHYTLKEPEKYGITAPDVTLGSCSADASVAAAAFAENTLRSLEAFHENELSADNRLTLETLRDSLRQTADGAAFPYYDEPLRPSTGVQSELPVLLAEYAFRDKADVEEYLQLLSGIPAYFSEICRYEQEKSAAGLFMADFAAETIIRQCEDFAASKDQNYLIYTFNEKTAALTGISRNEKTAFCRQNAAIVTEQVLPAFQDIADSLKKLKGSGTNPAGLCAFPNGKAYYESLVRRSTGSGDSVQKLQERTKNQRLRDLADAAALLKKDPSLEQQAEAAAAPAEDPKEMLNLLRGRMTENFPLPPDCRSTVKTVDEAMEAYLAPAFYLASPLDDMQDNSIYINEKNGYEGIRLFTTLAHEGFPGHLYQNVMFHSSSPDLIRALLSYPGYTEGWATYVELWSYRYADIPENAACLLALDQSAVLSLYATADMGIHCDGWSYTDTFRFFSEYGIDDASAVREIFELIVEEPAHYLKYYIGYLEFLSLRAYAKELQKDAFSDPDFHRAVLEIGPAPFPVIKKYLADFLPEADGKSPVSRRRGP